MTDPPRWYQSSSEGKEVLEGPRRLEFVTNATHGTIQDYPLVGPGAAEGDEESDCATEGFGVEEAG